ncbi:MAG: hypothetical protein A2527_01690 [Candidatus Lambdaproteobacteria bacterium RIFOXYD2_FULL_50_16]|uniref:Glycosyltransferase 2-like domain-containing protein n=1 Tax=Candidatus Lambdaproteobacteria bacterium RIFOXYD2_FULL_50_16 TaxID=1817772 RepID=A0A1F6G5S6_9PROT|nr:MAG: hypothetical protein A2527_01690 [Candidatus Lambdaproteobacteria bacterium RIFOXYD2_FULL_50_16]
MSERFPPFELPEPVSVLMPVSNEADVIATVVQEWAEEVFQYLPQGSEMVFDEAASTDGTREILAELQVKYPYIKVFSRDKKDGFANAARRLYKLATCPLIFFTDSDGQYVAKEFWTIASFIKDYDMVRGAKVGRKDPFGRRFSSFIFNKAVHFLFSISYDDINCAFHLIRRPLIEDLLPKLNIMETLINSELLLRAEISNYQIKQCYVTHRMRLFGNSRGLPSYRFVFDSLKAFNGLLRIKASYRVIDFTSKDQG